MQTDGDERHFDLGLLIVHPAIDPAEISRLLGMEAQTCQMAGSRRSTPEGRQLAGTYTETRWRWHEHMTTRSQWFEKELVKFVNKIAKQRSFLRELRSSGGSATIVIEFLGDGYFGDCISLSVLRQLVELEVDLGIECFTAPQAKRDR
jgi:hypothetical protein